MSEPRWRVGRTLGRSTAREGPQYEPKTFEQTLGYLIEEAGEVLPAAGKTLRWGHESVNPELPPEEQETNAAWLKRAAKARTFPTVSRGDGE